MPRTLPTNMETWLAKQGVISRPIILADIQTLDGTNFFWSDYEGYYPTELVLGARVQTSGGTSTLKYFLDFGLAANGVAFQLRGAVKNNAAVPLVVSSQYNSATLQPGESRQIILNFTGSGALDAQFRLETLNTADPIDCVAYAPFVGQVATGVNLIPSNKLKFTGWNTFSGSVATITQAFDVAPAQLYSGWIKGGFTFTVARDFSTNAGDLLLQNISGNTIDRDVSLALKSHEFEGALCIIRLWLPLFDDVLIEFHCSLSEQNPKEEEAGSRALALADFAQYAVAAETCSTLCVLRYKSNNCGSAGAAATCDKKFTTCQDGNHAAQERFRAVLTTVPNTLTAPILGQGGGGNAPSGPNPVRTPVMLGL